MAEATNQTESTVEHHTTTLMPMGDGKAICEICWQQQFPGRELPETGWVPGRCSNDTSDHIG